MNKQQMIKDIEKSLHAAWNNQEDKGFERLFKAYRFFTSVTENGEMAYHKLCEDVTDMRCGESGKNDFWRFVSRKLDSKLECSCSIEENELENAATDAANEYFLDQAHRLASYIVRIKGTQITDEFGAVV